jgi:ketosteroid isomerase-like protein
MDDQQVRETLAAMVTDLDPDAEYEQRHEDFVAEMPQSRERIRGRDDMRALQRAFPPDRAPTFRVRRITGGGDVWTVEAVGDYGGEIYLVVVIVEFRDGKILRETRYYPQPFEAPEWRAQWVERMDDAALPESSTPS